MSSLYKNSDWFACFGGKLSSEITFKPHVPSDQNVTFRYPECDNVEVISNGNIQKKVDVSSGFEKYHYFEKAYENLHMQNIRQFVPQIPSSQMNDIVNQLGIKNINTTKYYLVCSDEKDGFFSHKQNFDNAIRKVFGNSNSEGFIRKDVLYICHEDYPYIQIVKDQDTNHVFCFSHPELYSQKTVVDGAVGNSRDLIVNYSGFNDTLPNSKYTNQPKITIQGDNSLAFDHIFYITQENISDVKIESNTRFTTLKLDCSKITSPEILKSVWNGIFNNSAIKYKTVSDDVIKLSIPSSSKFKHAETKWSTDSPLCKECKIVIPILTKFSPEEDLLALFDNFINAATVKTMDSELLKIYGKYASYEDKDYKATLWSNSGKKDLFAIIGEWKDADLTKPAKVSIKGKETTVLDIDKINSLILYLLNFQNFCSANYDIGNGKKGGLMDAIITQTPITGTDLTKQNKVDFFNYKLGVFFSDLSGIIPSVLCQKRNHEFGIDLKTNSPETWLLKIINLITKSYNPENGLLISMSLLMKTLAVELIMPHLLHITFMYIMSFHYFSSHSIKSPLGIGNSDAQSIATTVKEQCKLYTTNKPNILTNVLLPIAGCGIFIPENVTNPGNPGTKMLSYVYKLLFYITNYYVRITKDASWYGKVGRILDDNLIGNKLGNKELSKIDVKYLRHDVIVDKLRTLKSGKTHIYASDSIDSTSNKIAKSAYTILRRNSCLLGYVKLS